MIHRSQVERAIAKGQQLLEICDFGERAEPVPVHPDHLRALVTAAKSAQYHYINPMASTSAAYQSPSDYLEGT